jgi:hypothetical protein
VLRMKNQLLDLKLRLRIAIPYRTARTSVVFMICLLDNIRETSLRKSISRITKIPKRP